MKTYLIVFKTAEDHRAGVDMANDAVRNPNYDFQLVLSCLNLSVFLLRTQRDHAAVAALLDEWVAGSVEYWFAEHETSCVPTQLEVALEWAKAPLG